MNPETVDDDFIVVKRDQAPLLLYAVRDLISRRTLGNNSMPPGMHRLYHDLQAASLRGSRNVAAQTECDQEDLIDTAEAAVILKCSARWVRQIRNDLDGQNISGRWVFLRQTVADYADQKGGMQ